MLYLRSVTWDEISFVAQIPSLEYKAVLSDCPKYLMQKGLD